MTDHSRALAPARRLSVGDVAILIIGIMIGAGIFRVPADVAGGAASSTGALLLWLVGGLAALAGAFSYAELSSRFPSIGGEYHFLKLAFGPRLSAWFVWARLSVIQTGSIAAVAFVAGDQIVAVVPGGPAAGIWAIASIIFVTLAALTHLHVTRRLQQFLGAAVILAMLLVAAAGLVAQPAETAAVAPAAGAGTGMGAALIFVMLAYGGWNEAAYLSAEVKGGSRAMVRALVLGIVIVLLLYVAFNAALLHLLGLGGLASDPAPAVTAVTHAFGPGFGIAIAGAAAAAALTTINTSAITGARAMCALGRDMPLLHHIGNWDQGRSVPTVAMLVQAGVTLLLVAYGATAPDGFQAMVAFCSPVFWLFLVLVALSLFRLRRLYPKATGFSVPFYPVLPLLFLAATLYMLWSSFGYASFLFSTAEGGRLAGFLGIILLAAGLPLAWKAGKNENAGA